MRASASASASASARAFAFALALACGACAVGRAIVAEPDDMGAYRAFRAAAHPGTRLRRAQAYLERHPRGTWVDEVRAAWDEEEPRYFEAAKRSRNAARDYLVDLPRGPHAEQALMMLVEHDTKTEDVETARLLRDARRTEVVLERASGQRRAVGEHVLAWLAALLDPAIFGHRLAEAPGPLLRALDGPARRTWGTPPRTRTDELFFSVPGVRERESRLAAVTLALDMKGDAVAGATIGGRDLFVRWLEADAMKALDPTRPEHRAEAARHVTEVLRGALEAKLPAARCAAKDAAAATGVLVARACDGLGVVATAGSADGDVDAVFVGPEKTVVEVPAPPR